MSDTPISLKIEGMTCNHCASTVDGIINLEGGKNVHVDYLMGEASFENESVNLDRLIKRLNKAGYPTSTDQIETIDTGKVSPIEKKFLISLPFAAALMSHMFLPHEHMLNTPWVQFILCLPVFVIGVLQFGKSALESVKSRNLNMDVLVFLGSSSAFAYSIYGMLFRTDHAHDFLFFETTATIITLVLLGYVIENRTVKKTTTELRELFKLKPSKAKKLVQNGLVQDLVVVNADTLQLDDLILVNTGDKIPADGILLHGNLRVDESMLTGEAEPVSKEKDASAYAGSIIVSGNATLKVTRVGQESTIGQIVNLVKQSRLDKPDVQRLADKISSWFVPTILVLAVLAFVVNYSMLDVGFTNSLLRSIAVLVIACPCAMGLATPTAVSVGLGVSARNRIILKRASIFEELTKVKHLVFDKTGTLSTGELDVVLLELHPEFDQSDMWSIVKALEQHSNHPLAEPFLRLTEELPAAELDNVEEVTGLGLQALWNGKSVQFGSEMFVKTTSSDADLYLKVDDTIVASFGVRDSIKPEASSQINALKSAGFSIHILSGDNEKKTKSFANKLGISSFQFRLMPSEKLREIDTLKQDGKTVMIGDGINDAPALAASDVGISMGMRNALASKSAGVVLLDESLEQIPRLFRLSKKIVRVIKQNLFWAFAYNIIAIPLAAFGYLDPMLAALSMAFSDVVVIGNSLRLRFSLSNNRF